MQTISQLKEIVEEWKGLDKEIRDTAEILNLIDENGDEALLPEIQREIEKIEKKISELELKKLLSGKDDHRDALLTIHPGAGGTEAQDWAEMLLRMYIR